MKLLLSKILTWNYKIPLILESNRFDSGTIIVLNLVGDMLSILLMKLVFCFQCYTQNISILKQIINFPFVTLVHYLLQRVDSFWLIGLDHFNFLMHKHKILALNCTVTRNRYVN